MQQMLTYKNLEPANVWSFRSKQDLNDYFVIKTIVDQFSFNQLID